MDGTTRQNQRKSHRISVRLTFSLVAKAGGKEITIPAESINLSKSGMRLKAETQLSSGETVEVTLMEGTPHPIVARVVWAAKPNNPNQYEFGLEYILPSPRPV
ncbi:MAG: PilZ domain-containing protein [Terriglobia bacterium]|jgi:hypothetical protein